MATTTKKKMPDASELEVEDEALAKLKRLVRKNLATTHPEVVDDLMRQYNEYINDNAGSKSAVIADAIRGLEDEAEEEEEEEEEVGPEYDEEEFLSYYKGVGRNLVAKYNMATADAKALLLKIKDTYLLGAFKRGVSVEDAAATIVNDTKAGDKPKVQVAPEVEQSAPPAPVVNLINIRYRTKASVTLASGLDTAHFSEEVEYDIPEGADIPKTREAVGISLSRRALGRAERLLEELEKNKVGRKGDSVVPPQETKAPPKQYVKERPTR